MTSYQGVIAVLLLSTLQLGSTITCFECVEEKGGDGVCRNENGDKHPTTNCNQDCIKHVVAPYTNGARVFNETTFRSCSDPLFCEIGTAHLQQTLGVTTLSCSFCSKDYCNTASIAVPSITLIAVLIVKYYF